MKAEANEQDRTGARSRPTLRRRRGESKSEEVRRSRRTVGNSLSGSSSSVGSSSNGDIGSEGGLVRREGFESLLSSDDQDGVVDVDSEHETG